MAKKLKEIESFTFAVFLATTEGREPMTETDATYNLCQMLADGIKLPEGVTPKLFMTFWNRFTQRSGKRCCH